jgi:hypothetical protein
MNHVPHRLVNRTSTLIWRLVLRFNSDRSVNTVGAFLESLPATLLYSKTDFRPEVLKPPERMRRTVERSR